MTRNFKYPIGGEFWFEDKFQDKNIFNDIESQGVLLSGGDSAIRFILNEISFKSHEVIALPSYLCPTIVKLIDKLKIKYKFYNINEDLSIDMESIENLISKYNIKSVFFIDYFGFYHDENTRKFLGNLKSKNILLIEDAVQKFWIKYEDKFIGDYVFNSYRKFIPIDGSLVLFNKDKNLNNINSLNKNNKLVEFKKINDSLKYIERNDDYFQFMEKARDLKTKFILEGIGNENEYLNLFDKAHKAYYEGKDIFKINPKHKIFLNYFPGNKLIKKRNENYKYLFKNLKNIKEITFLNHSENLYDNTPLVFPILIENRDYIKKQLMNRNIYIPVHWDLSNEVWINEFQESLSISKRILSLQIDWRYEIQDMDFLINSLKDILK
ncbi:MULTISPECIES: DegT/DnrJ/EryC1/StrS aminotransferase family protein [Clostridium]|uniref:DegT/DnrJ/EryC1/StrS aminotransferase family protein n=1 Tax=Clostridium TaxID=1485 RepID=UPI0013C83CC3|nr:MULTISPECIES: DegT/DnrJ/EryC1/StrS aminotransferase family protein [Clostridium]MBN1041789.1 DegT/DnrJ/EryC1/StrS aminotransferase family protein [Clostridium botulinum]MBY6917992.1 DegT/DnrJ/EryC1/StrS aminotransferase family protein [Clostridium botulinum]MBY7024233.1 DegT/DnrJ/EryC1/StrS aminotransferase family protein [Clostridium botulinum]NFL36320.1 DegT/DnrJ/EryC1/StrS aminotransferase family protein [Clostridium botulinum]NFM03623.1 DegT/DnrJ/EryC1/StrS aminotransferase family prote